MTVKRNLFTDCCVYIGSNDCFGRANSVSAPVIKNSKIELKDLGSIGAIKLSNGKIDAIESTINLNCFYEDVFKKIANPFSAVDIKVYGNFMEYENDSAVDNISSKLFMRGTSQEFGLLGDMKEHDNMEYEMKFDLTMARLVYKGKELYYIDIPNNIWIVNGVDVRRNILKNLGLV